MKKRVILLGVMVLLISAVLCACSGGKTSETETSNSGNTSLEGTPTSGGSVIVGMTQDLVSLDPHQITDAGTRNVVFNLYEGLVKPTPEGDLTPAVASDYSISEDAKTYTFVLRSGLTFHDGSAVTAGDIKYSIERYAEIQGESSAFSILDEVVIEDESTVSVKLKEANSEFLPALTLAIIPQANANPSGNPIGTGPFKYVSYAPGQNLKLEKFADYWQEGLPYLDSVQFKFIADVDTAFMELQAGTLDILNYLTASQVSTLSDQFQIVEGSMNLVQGMFLNNDYEPLANVSVRQALCYAVNRQEINDFLFGGKSHLIGSHMIPSITRYYESGAENLYAYDPDKAKSLLTKAGYANGFDLEITVPSSFSQHINTAQIIAEQLKAVGINATIRQVEWSSWLSDVYAGRNYQATVIGFDGTLSPGEWLGRYTSDSAVNMMNYSNAEYDQVYAEAKATIDDTKKAELYKQLQMLLAEDAASVYIEDPADFVAVNQRLGGYAFYPVAAQDLSTVYVKEK